MDQTIIMGLGNPDPALEHTYHNVGLLAMEWLAQAYADAPGEPVHFKPYKDLFEYAKVMDPEKSWHCYFIRQMVYMNESGRAAKEALRMANAEPSNLIIIHDDSDLPIGTFKPATGGGSAGHKGVQSIIDHLGTQDFKRVRIGIRPADEGERKKAGDFVLSQIIPKDMKTFREIFQEIFSTI